MLKNVKRLKRLINQLLDLRKIEEGHLTMEWTQGDIVKFLRKIYKSFELYAEKRNINLTFHSNIEQFLLILMQINLIKLFLTLCPMHLNILITMERYL